MMELEYSTIQFLGTALAGTLRSVAMLSSPHLGVLRPVELALEATVQYGANPKILSRYTVPRPQHDTRRHAHGDSPRARSGASNRPPPLCATLAARPRTCPISGPMGP